jgi:hypothetical protein
MDAESRQLITQLAAQVQARLTSLLQHSASYRKYRTLDLQATLFVIMGSIRTLVTHHLKRSV